ncbi:MAG: NAD(P)/FAD-dependent oxidoreductase [Verrucomicrobia bacterium]|nr:NAD(P)/FAD-dependent oxidoreductase [Verrucomicrobiota bacterium]
MDEAKKKFTDPGGPARPRHGGPEHSAVLRGSPMREPNLRSTGKIKTVAIIGGGPVASTLATLLARAGLRPAILYLPKRAPLLVGESLVPAIIPILRLLGVEEEVAGYSVFKPGATINLTPTFNLCFPFADLETKLPRYAYNSPRDKFDDTLLAAARRAGVQMVETAATLERVPGTDRVQLSRETLAAVAHIFPQPPDLIVDATGRARVLPKLLDLPSRRGPREDTALFAHVDSAKLDHAGHVHTTLLDHGWSWRIPLPGRTSVGMVIGSEHLPKFGATKEEQYDNLLTQDSVLRLVAGESKRITPVMEYKNYQLVSTRLVGDGWVLVGDTAGFIDPVFSSGLLIGMQGAVALAEAICQGSPRAFKAYERETIHHLEAWHELVEYFYGGRLFTSFQVGDAMLKTNFLIRLVFPHMRKHFGAIFTGGASNSNYSLAILRFTMRHGLRDEDPKTLMVR